MLRLKIDKPCNINLFQSHSLPANSSLWDIPTLISCWGNATLGSLEAFPGFCPIRALWEDIPHTPKHKWEWRGQMKELLLSLPGPSMILLSAFPHCWEAGWGWETAGMLREGFGKGRGQEMHLSLVCGHTNRIVLWFLLHP